MPISKFTDTGPNASQLLLRFQDGFVTWAARATVFYILETVRVRMIYRVLQKMDPLEGRTEGGDFLIDKIFQPLLLTIQSQAIAKLQVLNADNWGRVLCSVARLSPITTIGFMKAALAENFHFEPQYVFLFTLLKYVDFSAVPARYDWVPLKPGIVKVIEQIQSSRSATLSEAITHFLTSFASQLLVKLNGIATHPILNALLQFGQASGKKQSACSVRLLISFYMFSLSSASHSLEWILKSCAACAQSGSIVLDGLTQILSGRNFAIFLGDILPIRAQAFRMSPQDAEFRRAIFEVGFNQSLTCPGAELEIARFLVHFGLNDFSDFLTTYLPRLTSAPFLPDNCGALFRACAALVGARELNSSFRNVMPRFKAQAQELMTRYLNEAVPDSGSFVYGIGPIEDTDIVDNSEPRSAQLPTCKRFQAHVSQWNKVIYPENPRAKLFELHSGDSLCCPSEFVLVSSHLLPCLALAYFLPYTDSVVSILVCLTAHKVVHVATAASKTLLKIADANPLKVPEIIEHVASTDTIDSHEHLFMRIDVAISILSGRRLQKFDCVMPLVILGLCCPSVDVRLRGLALVRLIPDLNRYILANEREIFNVSILKIRNILSSECDPNLLRALPMHSFFDIIASSYWFLGHVFLSIFFSEIRDSAILALISTARAAVQDFTSRVFAKPDRDATALFCINLCTYIVATATISEPAAEPLNKVIMKVCETVMEMKESWYVFLFSFVAAVNSSRIQGILERFTGPNPLYLRALSFAVLLCWTRQINQDLVQLQEDLFHVSGRIVGFCNAFEYVSNVDVRTVDMKRILHAAPPLVDCLCDLVKLVLMICDFHAHLHKTEPFGPFLRKQCVRKHLGHTDWFIFLLNLSLINDTAYSKLTRSANLAFAAFLSVTPIPENSAELVTKNLTGIAGFNQAAASNILSHSYGVMLSGFINESVRNPNFFRCIASQFEEFSNLEQARSLLQKRLAGTGSEFDRQFVDTTWSYLGELVALCLYYLSGFDPGDVGESQADARRLLANLIVSTAVIRQREDYLKLLLHIETDRGNGNLGFRSLIELSQELATTFSFCREGFLVRALTVEYHKAGGVMPLFFSCLLEPWLQNIQLNSREPGIAPGCDQKYLARLPFVESFICAFCRSYPLQPPVIDLIAKLRDTETLFVLALRLARKHVPECLNFLTYLCLGNSALIEKVGEILTFPYWYFEMIHLSQCDRESDGRAFFATRDADPDGFQSLTAFDCTLASILLKLSPKTAQQLKPPLLAFCFIHQCPQTETILQQILGFATDSIDAISNSLTDSQTLAFARICFDWAVACGEISRASRAAVAALHTLTESSSERIDLVLRTLKISLKVLQAVDGSNAKPADGDFMQVKYKSDLREFYTYIANLLRLLSKLNLMLERPWPKVVKTIVGFLVCSGFHDLIAIYEAVIDSIYDHLIAHPPVIQLPESFPGIISETRHCQFKEEAAGRETNIKLCNIIFLLAKAGHVQFLVRTASPQAAMASAIVVLLPYATACPERLAELSRVSRETLGISLDGRSIPEVVSLLLGKMEVQHIKMVFAFLANVIIEIPEYSATLFEVSSKLIDLPDLQYRAHYMTKIYKMATTASNGTNAAPACRFLAVCRSHSVSGDTQLHPSSKAFPQIAVYSDLSIKEIDDTLIPPLCLVDFNGIEIVGRLRRACASIQFRSLSQWFRLMVTAEVTDVDLPRCESISWNIGMYDRFSELVARLSPRTLPVRRASGLGSIAGKELSFEGFLIVDPVVFTASPEELAEIMRDLDFPMILPLAETIR